MFKISSMKAAIHLGPNFKSNLEIYKNIQKLVREHSEEIQNVKCLKYSSYQDAVGNDGEAIDFEWTNFPGFSSLSILEQIQQDLEKRAFQPEE